ncbi:MULTISPECIES: metal ABC transporter substrate-binding protein [Gordonia]|uniref:metal ABC transporter substrate-binding protein n=1 Tax=Gordonia TaxID=2053 RepID=UPI002446EF92|nr:MULTISPECIES: metal ABC transporter substrate-binding protein [Gordonia]MDH3009275.1 metal ABC transporter substrate-binding protein [Gordonia alkanivorans]MDH3010609.1 metal ABC transporter substrate-binding protein [Gordonia alkanivorans]MDH3043561.1 metal ABC transporter substrate-binding protein [Gordonia alkanivorans]MDH3048067.1 metal ABC transporter substrate-binding protein [Gordonia alkanivorans]WJG12433.1 metal ABC transporter substrate-binding protein [Gordonia sp. Swx-4]
MPKVRARRLLSVGALIIALCTVVSGCTLSSRLPDEKVVLTTFTVLADIASNVAGDRLRVESITKPGAEIHGYEPTPGDVRRTATASLVVDNGLNLEAWFGQFVDGLDVEHVVASDGIDPINIASDAYAGKPNPHAWMSPVNVGIYVDNLVDAFTDLDPEGAEIFAANGAAYKRQLQQVQTDLVAALDRLPPNERALVTCEGAFSYLARDAGLTERYIWPVNAEQQATPQQVAATIDFVRTNRVPAVFCESTVSDAAMQQVVGATDARFGGTLYVDSLSEADGPVPTYLDLIRHDARTIVSGLTGDNR